MESAKNLRKMRAKSGSSIMRDITSKNEQDRRSVYAGAYSKAPPNRIGWMGSIPEKGNMKKREMENQGMKARDGEPRNENERC